MWKLNTATAIFLGLAVLLTLYGVDIIRRHGFDESWPGHARYHVTLSGMHLVCFAATIAVAAIGGLRKRRRSAWLMLAIVAIPGLAAWPAARALAGDPPPADVQLHLGGALVVVLVALALSFGDCFDRTRQEPTD